MIDCLKHVYLVNDVKKTLSLVCKEIYNLKYLEIKDDLSKHIIKNKGYLDKELYLDIKKNLYKLRKYKSYFDINSIRFVFTGINLLLNNITISFYGLNNIQQIHIGNISIKNIDVRSLSNLKSLTLIGCDLRYINLNDNINLEYLNLDHNKLSYIDLKNNSKLKVLYLSDNQIFILNIQHLEDLIYINLRGNNFIHVKYPMQNLIGKYTLNWFHIFYILDIFLSPIIPLITHFTRLCLYKEIYYVNKKFMFDIFINIFYMINYISFYNESMNMNLNIYLKSVLFYMLSAKIGYHLW